MATGTGTATATPETGTGTGTATETGTRDGDGDGDGDDGDPPEQPLLELGFSPIKQFDFAWAPALGADYYRLLEQNVGDADYVQVGGDVVGTSTALTVPVHQRLGSSYLLEACNDWGCTASAAVEVVGTLAEAVGYFKASNTDADDRFGYSVALSGDGSTLAVGAWREDSNATGIDGGQADNTAFNSGAVYVFVRDELDVWTQQAYVKASNTDMSDRFGTSVALSGDGSTLAVGAWEEDSHASGINGDQTSNFASNAGAVYVFVRDEIDVWTQQAYVKASNPGAGDLFGTSVALSGDGSTLAVGAYLEDSNATGINGNQTDNSASAAGAAYVFVRNDLDIWTQQAYVKASNTGAGDRFGERVALSGDGSTLAVGAYWEDSNATGIDGDQANNTAQDAGAVYVFTRELDVWTQQAYVKASNTGASDEFGRSVTLSGDGSTLAVGADLEDSNTTGIDGNQASNFATNSGAVYLFARDELDIWTQQAYVKASNTDANDRFGRSVALSGDGSTLAVGALGEDSNAIGIGGDQADNSVSWAGAVYVFVRDDLDSWAQQAYVKASNTGADDFFGTSVALSVDGSTLAVGAEAEDSNATGIDGDQADNTASFSGAVYLY